MLRVLVVEDSERLQPALVAGLNATQKVQVLHAVASGVAGLDYCATADDLPDAILMDVALAGEMNARACRSSFIRFRMMMPTSEPS